MSNNKQIQKRLELPHRETLVGINTIQTNPFDNQKTTTMSNNKQSSVEWLISQLQKSKDWHRVLNEISQMSSARVDIIEQAKAMHKEECITYAHDFARQMLQNRRFVTPEIVYNETFGECNQ